MKWTWQILGRGFVMLALWSSQSRAELETNDLIVIEIEESFSARPIVRGDTFTYETNGILYCKVHRAELRDDIVRVIYGFPLFHPEFMQAWKERFPNAHDVSHGGCVPMDDFFSPGHVVTKTTVQFCEECREAKRKWAPLNRTNVVSSLASGTISNSAHAQQKLLRITNDQ